MTELWEKVTLATGDLHLTCLPGIGGRLWDVAFKGASLLFQNPDLIGTVPELSALKELPTRSPQFHFPLWGGEKTWIAPDTDWVDQAPYPRLDSGPYKVVSADKRSVQMRSEVCDISGLQIDRTIRVVSPDGWTILHRVQNCGASERRVGIWSVLMLKHPGRIGLQSTDDRSVSTIFGDAAGRIRRKGDVLGFDCGSPQEFKCGLPNASGRVVISLGKSAGPIWLICRTDPVTSGERFAHGHGFEVFNSGDYPYFEAEWHSPAHSLVPGASMSFVQQFSIRADPQTRSTGTRLSPTEQEIARCMS